MNPTAFAYGKVSFTMRDMTRFLPKVSDVSLELASAEKHYPKSSFFSFLMVPLTLLCFVTSSAFMMNAFSEGFSVSQEGSLTSGFVGFGVSALMGLSGFVTHRVVTRKVRRRLKKMTPEELRNLRIDAAFTHPEFLPASLVNNSDVTVAERAKALIVNWKGSSLETRKIALGKALGGFEGTFGDLMEVSRKEFTEVGVEKTETVLSIEQRSTISSIETLLGQLPEGLFEEFEGLYREVKMGALRSLGAFEKAQALENADSEFYERLRLRVEQDNIRLLGLLNDLDVLTESLKVDSLDEVTAGVGYLKQAAVSISPKLKL